MEIYAMEKEGEGRGEPKKRGICCFFCRVVREGHTEVLFKQMTGKPCGYLDAELSGQI